MCWNPDISLNTFVFGLFTLLFLFFTNTFSQYKIHAFSNPFLYLFILEVISVQLVEFFLWRNLDNKRLNKTLTFIIFLLVGSQPPTLMMLIQEPITRNTLLLIYGLFALTYFSFQQQVHPFSLHTIVAKNGHLNWEWNKLNGLENIWLFVFLAFYLVSAFFIGNNCLSFLIVVSTAISLYFYFTAGTFGSMWCWLSNFSFLLLLAYVLFVLPFREYHSLC